MAVVIDPALGRLFTLIVGLLAAATAIGAALRRTVVAADARATVDNLNARIRAWWVMAAVFIASTLLGRTGSVLLFALVSLLALREFRALGPTAPADRRTLAWSFFIATPLQYFLIWRGWYGLFAVLVPVYVTLFVAIRSALAGDTEHYLERTAITQFALMTCVYFVGYVPAILLLASAGRRARQRHAALLPRPGRAVERCAAGTCGARPWDGTASRRASARTRPGRAWSEASCQRPRSGRPSGGQRRSPRRRRR